MRQMLSSPGRLSIAVGLFVAIAVAIPSPSLGGITFEFDFSENDNEAARAGFQEAANIISGHFDDDITFKIKADYRNLGGSGVLGQASSSGVIHAYQNWRSAVQNDVISQSDTTFSSNLPTGNSFSVYINRPAANVNPYLDSSGNNVQNVAMSYANAKALGLGLPSSPNPFDATIAFNSNYTWDFDRSDGITNNRYDFVGVAMHEIIHAMGFISGADRVDTSEAGVSDDSLYARSLDFTRHSADSLAAGADLDLTADTRSKFFSIDGGDTVIGDSNGWSTGVNFGDGRQASHWKDNRGLGIMDPTAGRNELLVLSERDLQALDVIGWNRVSAVPEPTALPILALGAAWLFWRRQRTRRKQQATD